MKIADFFRGVATVVLADIEKVFTTAKAAVAAAPLPDNLKTDLAQTVTDAHADVTSATALAGTAVAGAIANGVDDVTTLFMNTANAVAGAKSLSDFTAAEKAVLQKTWAAMTAQGNTLLAQALVGIDPTKPAVAVNG